VRASTDIDRPEGRRPLLSIRWTIFGAFALMVLAGGAVSVLLGYTLTSDAVIGEAQRRVEQDLHSAWALYDQQLENVRHTTRFVSILRRSQDVLSGQASGGEVDDLRRRLEAIRNRAGMDTLTLVGNDGRTVMRTRAPYTNGDIALMDPVRRDAVLTGSAAGTVRLPATVLAADGAELLERATIEVRPTPMASSTVERLESDGLMIEAAETVSDDAGRPLGMVVGGILLNRNWSIPDAIRDTVFRNETFDGRPLGTATIFMRDVRIATNVLGEDGMRAIGTRVSRAVEDVVLADGKPYRDRAFVVNDWYLSAYDPLRDLDGKVVGILYVGILEAKFLGYRTRLIQSFVWLTAAGMLIALLFGLAMALWLSRPIRRLTDAAMRMAALDLNARVPTSGGVFKDLHTLNHAFNQMADNLDRESEALVRSNAALQSSNANLKQLNQNYMDMLEFVTHELKSPLASCLFGVGSLKEGLIGQPNGEQARVLDAVERNLEYLNEMILNYLNLSRIEKNELRFEPRSLSFRKEVLDPTMEQVSRQVYATGMFVAIDVPEDVMVKGDRDLLRIVMDNLLSNAVKYGRHYSTIRVWHEELPSGVQRFRVQNEGRGFRPADIEKLFRKFSRLDVAELRAKRGTGLGLFITRQIIERHGGQIRAETRENQWAMFVFDLPGG
jgi:two-component system NtrC family sensor kinase